MVPTLLNINGGNGRPVFEDVWQGVCDQLDGTSTLRRKRTTGFFSAAAW